MRIVAAAFTLLTASIASAQETQSPYACLRTGILPNAQPFLPFYQPTVTDGDIDQIVKVGDPLSNTFNVLNNYNGPFPMQPSGWALEQWTGFSPGAPLASFQRSRTLAYAESSVQVRGNRVGIWTNSMDADAAGAAGNGSNVIQSGCWFHDGQPFARMFPTSQSVFDVSFKASVHYDGVVGNANAQSYFQLIARDMSGSLCGANNACTGGNGALRPCALSLSVTFYVKDSSPFSPEGNITSDATCTLAMPLAGIAFGAESPAHPWITTLSGKLYTAEFDEDDFRFRISRASFQSLLTEARASSPSMANMSINPDDYAFTLLNLNNESYDPCQDPTGQRPCRDEDTDHSQTGMNYRDFRVSTTIPHLAPGGATGFSGNGAQVVFSSTGFLNSQVRVWDPTVAAYRFREAIPPGPSQATITGRLTGHVAGSAPRVVYRDTAGKIFESVFWNNAWSTWDMTTIPGAALSVSDPKPFVDGSGLPHVVYRDVIGNVHDLYNSNLAWYHRNPTAEIGGTPAHGHPFGFLAGFAPRIVFRDGGGNIRQLVLWNNVWTEMNMSLVPGAVTASSDPHAVVDAAGNPHIIYLGTDGHLHDVYLLNLAWQHTNLTATAGLYTGLTGQPQGYVSEGLIRVVFRDIAGRVLQLAYAGDQCVAPGCTLTDLSQTRGALRSVSDPWGFVGPDGIARIVYSTADEQLHELHRVGGSWFHVDL
jgi:hypothetical protein